MSWACCFIYSWFMNICEPSNYLLIPPFIGVWSPELVHNYRMNKLFLLNPLEIMVISSPSLFSMKIQPPKRQPWKTAVCSRNRSYMDTPVGENDIKYRWRLLGMWPKQTWGDHDDPRMSDHEWSSCPSHLSMLGGLMGKSSQKLF